MKIGRGLFARKRSLSCSWRAHTVVLSNAMEERSKNSLETSSISLRMIDECRKEWQHGKITVERQLQKPIHTAGTRLPDFGYS